MEEDEGNENSLWDSDQIIHFLKVLNNLTADDKDSVPLSVELPATRLTAPALIIRDGQWI